MILGAEGCFFAKLWLISHGFPFERSAPPFMGFLLRGQVLTKFDAT